MADTSVRLSELRGLSQEERTRRLSSLARAAFAAPNGEVEKLDARIRVFECKYEKRSDHMLQDFNEGKIRETADIASWLVLLRARDRVGERQPS